MTTRIIIAGSRSGFVLDDVRYAMNQARDKWKLVPASVMIISGGARGVDSLGEIWATEKRLPIERFPAQWDLYGHSAGYRRNVEMASVADYLVALWDGISRGTGHMIDIAKSKNLKILVMGTNRVELYASA